jgi:hypothetical protein
VTAGFTVTPAVNPSIGNFSQLQHLKKFIKTPEIHLHADQSFIIIPARFTRAFS